MNLYVSVIGSFKNQIIDGPYDRDTVTWVPEGGVGTFSDTVPDDDDFVANIDASLPGIPTALAARGIAASFSGRMMYGMETYPLCAGYCLPVHWDKNYDTDLDDLTYNTRVRHAGEAFLDTVYAYGPNISAGYHLILNRNPYSRASKGFFNEPPAFEGSAATLGWYYDKIKAVGGTVFCWLYVTYNVGNTDGTGTTSEQEAFEFAARNVSYQRAFALSKGLSMNDLVFYIWWETNGVDVHPTIATLTQMIAGCREAGAEHLVVAMGAVDSADDLDRFNAYLRDVVIPAITGEESDREDEEAADDCGAIDYARSGCDGGIDVVAPCCEDAADDDDDDEGGDDPTLIPEVGTPNLPTTPGLAPGYTIIVGDPTDPGGTWDGYQAGPFGGGGGGLDNGPPGIVLTTTVNHEILGGSQTIDTGLPGGTAGYREDGVFVGFEASPAPDILINGSPALSAGATGGTAFTAH